MARIETQQLANPWIPRQTKLRLLNFLLRAWNRGGKDVKHTQKKIKINHILKKIKQNGSLSCLRIKIISQVHSGKRLYSCFRLANQLACRYFLSPCLDNSSRAKSWGKRQQIEWRRPVAPRRLKHSSAPCRIEAVVQQGRMLPPGRKKKCTKSYTFFFINCE